MLALDRPLSTRFGEWFAAKFDVLLSDLTSSYVEGAAPKDPLLHQGYSRGHLGDCKHVVLALIVNVEGFPLSDESFDGDRTDVITPETVMRMVERKSGQGAGPGCWTAASPVRRLFPAAMLARRFFHTQ